MEQDILNVIEKYKKYFELWKADVAIGTKGDYLFYVLDGADELELLMFFKTAAELEKIILGTLAENMTFVIESITDEMSIEIPKLSQAALKQHDDITDYLPLLAAQFSFIRKEIENWSDMIELTFKTLEGIKDNQ